jgi:poly(hydroxyalkanoate) depolymerase family esterase
VRRRLLAGALLLAALLPVPAGAADPGQFTTHSFSNAQGTLAYKLYTPPRRGPAPKALVVVLPGGGETAELAATRSGWNVVAEQRRFVVAYPEQSLDYDAGRTWDWATASREGRGNREASVIAGITAHVTATQRLDPDRVFVMGISAGAGMASAMAVAFPDLYHGLGIQAGCPFDNVGCAGGSVTAAQSAAAVVAGMGGFARPIPVFNEYGSLDPIAVGVSSHQVVPTWLTVADLLDDGVDDGSVSRSAATSEVVTPAPPYKPYRDEVFRDHRGCALARDWVVLGESHAWSGGTPSEPTDVSADPLAPDAATAMHAFFTSPDTLGGSARCA